MQRLFRHHLLFRIMCIICYINAIFFVSVGIFRTGEGFYLLYKNLSSPEWQYPGKHIAESLDAFMLALLFMIFGFGIYRLFIRHEEDDDRFPKWLQVKSISDLKFLLWETILVTLIVFTVLNFAGKETLTIEALIGPGAVLLLSLAYFLVSKGKKH